MKFYLGTHQPGWLNTCQVPLFVSDVRLRGYKSLPRAAASWALDSGGFGELQRYGKWTVTPTEYVHRVRRYRDEIGRLDWAAQQDWMCEKIIIEGGVANGQRFVGTGLSVLEHQWRTVENYFELRELAPEINFVPALQGDTVDSYLCHIDLWRGAGVDLASLPRVAVGSVCRRQSTAEGAEIFQAIYDAGVTRLHGFGVKIQGLARFGRLLASADSLAWSFDARRTAPLPGCEEHKNCANCVKYALGWRTRMLANLA